MTIEDLLNRLTLIPDKSMQVLFECLDCQRDIYIKEMKIVGSLDPSGKHAVILSEL